MKRLHGVRGLASVVLAVSMVATFSTVVGVAGSSSAASGSTFVIGSVSSVLKIDPDTVTNFLDFESLGLIYETLVKYNTKLQVVPGLATKWAFSKGNTTLTLTLRQNVKFDDGTTMTSADVVASLQRAQLAATADPSAMYIASVTGIAASGPNTVVLTMSHADTSVIQGLTTVNMAIMPAAAITAGTIATKPDGTGPFEFSNWTPTTSFTVTANPSYWGGTVSLASVEIETIPTETSISAALQAGTIQMGLFAQPTVVATVPTTYPIQKVMNLSYRALQLQDTSGVFKNVNARRALACAVDRKQVLNDAVFGKGKIVGPIPLGPYATNPVSSICPTQNLAQARKYLKAAGLPKGYTFTAITSTDLDSTSLAQAIAVQSELAQVGIKMNIQNLASAAYIQDWLHGTFQAAFADNGANLNPYVMYGRYFGAGGTLSVPAGYVSTKTQGLLLAGDEKSTVKAETKAWAAFSDNLTGNAVWVWLFDSYQFCALAPNVHGFTLSPVNTTQLLSLSKTTLS
jgi:peptide/nickel transport system substrate-binding protein